MNEFWQTCVQKLEQELPPQQISAWIRPLVPLAFDEEQGVLRVSAPNRFKLDWVRKNFSHQIEALASDWFSRPVQVTFELPAAGASRAAGGYARPGIAPGAGPGTAGGADGGAPIGAPLNPIAANGGNHGAAPSGGVTAATPAAAAATAAVEALHDRSRLNAELTFENFVTGKANQLARAAALQVAENPGVSYNPLFLYGGVGLGKTHLIHAIGNSLLANGKGARVRYVHADQYVSDVVK